MTTSTVEQWAVANAMPVTHHRTTKIEGLNILYREAGRADALAVLLLHGFPSSSHMFLQLIPTLAGPVRGGIEGDPARSAGCSGSTGANQKVQAGRLWARVEQALVFTASAWDSNCPQHIPRRLEADEVKLMLA